MFPNVSAILNSEYLTEYMQLKSRRLSFILLYALQTLDNVQSNSWTTITDCYRIVRSCRRDCDNGRI